MKAAPLRVRQLERRRVLDAAVETVVASLPVTNAPPPADAPVFTLDATPIILYQTEENGAAANAESPGGGLAANNAPVLVVPVDQIVDEGTPLDLSGTGGAPPLGLYVDSDLADTHTATVDWGDGSPIQNTTITVGVGAGVLGGVHTYLDDGVYTVTISVFDNNGGSDVESFDVTVQNVPPVLQTALDQTVNEGQLLDLSGSGGAPPLGLFVDAGLLDTHTATVNWGDGSATENATIFQGMGAGALGGSHTYADNGLYIVTVTVTDDDGGSDTESFNVTVNNVAPFVDLTGPTSVDEGSANNWNLGPVVDPGTDTVTQYIIHWGDGDTDTYTAAEIAGMSGVIGHTYTDGPNNYAITVDLVDEDGTHLAVDTLNVTVNNVAPFVDLTGPTVVNEGSPESWTIGPVVDPGVDTVTQYIIHWGDGNTDTYTAAEIAGMSNLVGHTYADGPNNYTIVVDLVDEDDTHFAVDTLAVTVNNVPPMVEITGPAVVDEGMPNDWMLGPILDPGDDTVSQYIIHWGDGDTDTFTAVEIASMGNLVGHTYDEGPNNYTIVVDLVDEDDTYLSVATFAVTVNNVAPTVSLDAVPDVNENGVATLTGLYTDPGRQDAHTVTVSWGDPNNGLTSTFAVDAIVDSSGTSTLSVGDTFSSSTDAAILTITSIDPATGEVEFAVQHQYLDDGLALGNGTISDVSTIGVTVTDDDTDSGNDTTSVTVFNVASSVNLNSVSDINENGIATLAGTYTDIGLLDAHTLTVAWSDLNNSLASTFAINAIQNAAGTATLSVGQMFASSTDLAVLTITSINAATGEIDFTVQHQYLDDGLAPGNNTISDVSTIGVTVADDDAQSGNDTTTVTVQNVTPSVALDAVPDINENGTATLSGNYTDTGLLDAHIVTVNWNDPNIASPSTFAVSAIQNAAGIATLNVGDTFSSSTDGAVLAITAINATTGQVSFSVQHQYLDDGLALGNNTSSDVSTIGVTVADDDAQSGNNTTPVTVHNVAPAVVLGAVTDINENGFATLTGSYTDIGLLDAHTLTVNWNDPNNSSPSTFAVNAIRDAAGSSTLGVGNTFVSSTDGAILTITFINSVTGQVSFSVQHQYLDDGLAPGNGTISDVSTIGVTVADDDAQSGANTTSVTVHNVTSLVVLGAASDINENGIATLTGSYTDIGLLDGHALTVNWNDPNNSAASTFTIPAIRNAAGVLTLSMGNTFSSSTDGAILTITSVDAVIGEVGFSVQHQYLDDGLAPGNGTISDVSTIGVTVADDDAQSGNNSTPVTVQNVTPTVSLNAVSDIDENGIATLTGSYTDIGLLDVHTLTVAWNDPNNALASTFTINAIQNATGLATLSIGQMFSSSTDLAVLTITTIDAATGHVGFTVQHQYLDDGLAPGNGTISDVSTIGVTVADDDAQSGNNTTPVTVHNVTPAVALNSVPDINENGIATLTGTYTDIGLLDVHTLTVDWNDPNNAFASTFTINAIRNAAGVATLSVGQMFASSTDLAVLTITSIDSATGEVGFTVEHQYLDDGLAPGNGTTSDVSTIGVTVADDDAQSGNDTTTVTVHNIMPAVVLNAVPDINENGVATLTGSYTDIGLLDGHVVTVDWNDPNNSAPSTFTVDSIRDAAGALTLNVGDTFSSTTDGEVLTITSVDATTGEVGFSVQHQYLDDGLAPGNGTTSDESTIGVTVLDDDTQSGNITTTVTVHNVTPVVLLGAVPDINENGIAALTGSFTDIGLLDVHTLTVGWNDPNNALASTFTISAIQNAAGAATLSIGQMFASSTDLAVLTITSIDLATGEVGFTVQHQYLDDGLAPGNGTISDVSTITVTVLDDDTQSGNDTTTVTVHNVAPTLINVVGDSINEGNVATISLNFVDPGSIDVFTANVDWRDGSTATIITLSLTNSSGTVGNTTYTWTAATRELVLSHLYADNSEYNVVVRVADDDMAANFGGVASASNFVEKTTLVSVANVAPILGGTTGIVVSEGTAFTLASLGMHLEDIGFDNSLNQTPPAVGDPFRETFAAATIDWGDGRGPIPVTFDNVSGRVSGSPGVNTTAQFIHGAYTYADDGTYTVTIRVADDNMGASADPTKFVSGTAGVDFVDLTFQITVNNVVPLLAAPAPSAISINEAQSVNFTAGFSDVGFDNPLNPNPAVPPLILDPTNESFRYFIDWGDGRNQVGALTPQAVADLNGNAGIPSTGSFGGTHNYADDGVYTVTIRIADDNMVAFNNTSAFASGVAGVDYIEQTFTVTVSNVPPSIVLPLQGDQVSALGFTQIRLSFNDPGYDNPLNQTPPPNGNQFQESFTYTVNWGDGTIDTITVINVAGTPQIVNAQTSVLSSNRTSGSEGILTTAGFEVQHRYLGPPDPLNPTANINIIVTFMDDNGGTVVQTIAITNPGINAFDVAIDTTPDVPRLDFTPVVPPPVLIDQATSAPATLQSTQTYTPRSEATITSELYLELVVVSPDGSEIERYRLSDEALVDLRGLFATLPDNRYKIFLKRTDNNSSRLVMDVFVRRGRVIDPSDDSEGTRDRPPTTEGVQQADGGQQEGAAPAGGVNQEAQPLDENPLLKRVPTTEKPSGAANVPNLPADDIVQPAAVESVDASTPAGRSHAMRWAVPLAGMGLVASRESWAERLGAALEQADERAWQRVRRAGRLSRIGPNRREKLTPVTNDAK